MLYYFQNQIDIKDLDVGHEIFSKTWPILFVANKFIYFMQAKIPS